MRSIVALHTTPALIEPVKALFAELMPDLRLTNLLDDSLVADLQDGDPRRMTDVRRRLFDHCRACEDAGAQAILSTCSSMGLLVDEIAPWLRIPLFKIDEPMARLAVEQGASIGVLMSNPTTRTPTLALLKTVAAQAGKPVRLVEGLAEGAFQALVEGRRERHDELLLAAAEGLAGECDLVVLAQGSMAPLQERLARATGKPVLASPRLGVMGVKAWCDSRR